MISFIKKCLMALTFTVLVSGNVSAAKLQPIEQPSQLRHVQVNDELSLDIYVPASQTGRTFPTLYVMDGQHYIYNAIGYQKALTKGSLSVDVSPEFIVVGLNTTALNKTESRGAYLNSRRDEFIQLLYEQIIPYVDKHTPSNLERYYFGWQFAATAGLSIFNAHPTLFKGYLLASGPYYTDDQFRRLETVLKTTPKLNSQFYLSLGKQELHATQAHNTFTGILAQHQSSGIRYQYNYTDQFSIRYDHFTTVFDSLTLGLDWLFSDYPDMTFYSVADVEQYGGIEAVKAYYQKRGSHYGISPDVGEQAKFSMFRHAVEEDNLAFFNLLEKTLGDYQVNSWHGMFGRFFAKHGLLERAINTYQGALNKNPNSHQVWSALADIYLQQNKQTQALEAYKKAKQFAPLDSEAHERYTLKIKTIEQ